MSTEIVEKKAIELPNGFVLNISESPNGTLLVTVAIPKTTKTETKPQEMYVHPSSRYGMYT